MKGGGGWPPATRDLLTASIGICPGSGLHLMTSCVMGGSKGWRRGFGRRRGAVARDLHHRHMHSTYHEDPRRLQGSRFGLRPLACLLAASAMAAGGAPTGHNPSPPPPHPYPP